MFGIVGCPSSLFINLSLFQSFLPTEGRYTSLFNRLGLRSTTSLQDILSLPLFILSSCGVSAFLFTHAIPRNRFLVCLNPYHSRTHGHLLSPRGGLHGPSETKYSLSPNSQLVACPAAGTDKLLFCLDSQQLLQCLCSESREGRRSGKS